MERPQLHVGTTPLTVVRLLGSGSTGRVYHCTLVATMQPLVLGGDVRGRRTRRCLCANTDSSVNTQLVPVPELGPGAKTLTRGVVVKVRTSTDSTKEEHNTDAADASQ